MLVEFSVRNYKSFKGAVTLRLEAGNNKEHRGNNVLEASLTNRMMPLLRSAAIFGANATGKSNLLDALQMMTEIVCTSYQDSEILPVVPFLFSETTRSEPTSFDVTFISGGVLYQYGFAATRERIDQEWLYAWPRGRRQTWFTRDESLAKPIRFGNKMKGDREVWRRATRRDSLLLSTAAALNSKQLVPVFEWFRNRVQFAGLDSGEVQRSLRWCQGERKARVIELLRVVDSSIRDVYFEGPQYRARGEADLIHQFSRNLWFVHKVPKNSQRTIEIPFLKSATGIRKVFALAGTLLECLDIGAVCVVDDLDVGVHPHISRFLIESFHNQTAKKAYAQLVFTSHNVVLLDDGVFLRDQVWFCERNDEFESTLCPLSEFKCRKGFRSVHQSYRAGRCGHHSD